MKTEHSFSQTLLWIAMVIVIVAVIASGMLTNITLRSIEKHLPNTLLTELHDLTLVLEDLSEVVSAAELTKIAPTSDNFSRLHDTVQTVYDGVVKLRHTYVFDNLIRASAFHAVVAPAITDLQIWLSEGVSGYGPETEMTADIVLSRISEAFKKAKTLSYDSRITAQNILNEQRTRLDQFLLNVNILFILTFLITIFMVFLLIRQYTLQRREAEAQIERRQTEKTLRESEKRFRELSDSLPQVVFETDEKGNLTFANKNAFDVFGYTRDDFDKGINVIQTLVPMDHNRALENIQSVMSGKILGTLEYTALKKEGSTFPVAIHSNPIFRDNKTVGLRGILIDLTEKKKLEAQLQQAHKMESIGTLAGGIAHDFNNIIGIIVGNTELAIDDVPEWNPARQNLEEIRTASLRARDVVKQILAFSRQSAQELKPVRIGPIIIESLQLVRSSIPTTIQIHQDISAESDTVRANPTQINQILINLCTNAAHAMRDKGGILEVNLENVTINKNASTNYHDIPLGEYVRLTVKDTGRGIDPENLKRIFDPYFTTKKVGEGSGMGLAVVHGIVKSHFGNIAVSSTEGKGTTFHVLLPCTEDKHDKETHVSAEIPRGNDRILLVDDEEAMVDAIKPMLERLGYQVAARTSSIEALEAFRANSDKYDLVITDYTMPNMTGIELTKKLLRLRPDIPIILCTGFSEQINEEKAKEKGIRAFLMKPIVMHEMANSIRKVLDQDR